MFFWILLFALKLYIKYMRKRLNFISFNSLNLYCIAHFEFFFSEIMPKCKRNYNENWSVKYFFHFVDDVAKCLVCSSTISTLKEDNLKRHYEKNHLYTCSKFQGTDRENKYKKLIETYNTPVIKILADKILSKNEKLTLISFEISHLIAKNSKPLNIGGLIKDSINAFVNIAYPGESSTDVDSISLSKQTVTRRVENISDFLISDLRIDIKHFVKFTLALDETCCRSDTAQMAFFIRGIDGDFNLKECFLDISHMKDTTTGSDILSAMLEVIKKHDIDISKLTGIATDGCPSLIGCRKGFVKLLVDELKKSDENLSDDFISCHCIIHQENLASTILSKTFDHVMSIVIKIINTIKSKGLTHRQFIEFLETIESEYGDLIYFSAVRWLSRGKMLRRLWDLLDEVKVFYELKGLSLPEEVNNSKWLCDFAFLVDICGHLNILNLKLQGRNQFAHHLFSHVKSFITKLELYKSQLDSENSFSFETLKTQGTNHIDFKKYSKEIEKLLNEFYSRFNDYRKIEILLLIFSTPFDVVVNDIPEQFQGEIIDLQTSIELKSKFKNSDILSFYKNLPQQDFPEIINNSQKISVLFASTYNCERLFSIMKNTKRENRSRLTDVHLTSCLRIASNEKEIDMKMVMKNYVSQFHSSH